MKRVLNVGGGASRELPTIYKGWQQDILDIDASVKPDIVLDAKQMTTLKPSQYDAVFCSHNLEHFYQHEVPLVLNGFKHVLRKTGFVHLAVPDLDALIKFVSTNACDLTDTWYHCGAGPITFHDVLYGWGRQVSQGNLYYAHKTGFTAKSLSRALGRAGFVSVRTASDGCSLHAFAFVQPASKQRLQEVGAA